MSQNPYQASNHDELDDELKQDHAEDEVPKKPAHAMVLGIIALVFASLGLLAQLIGTLFLSAIGDLVNELDENAAMPALDDPLIVVMLVIYAVLCIAEIIAGILMIKVKPLGRTLFIMVCALAIVHKIADVFVRMDETRASLDQNGDMPAEMQGMIDVVFIVSLAFGLLVALAWPVAGLIIATLPGNRRAYLTYAAYQDTDERD